MRTIDSNHGPIAKLDQVEKVALETALEILDAAKAIESANGKLDVRNFQDIELARLSLKIFIENRYLYEEGWAKR